MKNQITPTDRICRPVSVKYTEGCVSSAENLLADDGCAVLEYKKGGAKPYLCINLGPASPGGYPVFEVKAYSGSPILRIAYSDWYDYICDPTYREKGDFTRGTCKYLGPELPVLPANPDRFELYSICRTGKYIYPLIQGQQRFVLLTLDTPNSSVSISSFHIYYTSSMQPYEGGFRSSYPELDYLWDASIYTVQLATISNSRSLEHVEGRLAVRTLTKGNDASILKKGADWQDYTLSLQGEAVIHPHGSNSIRWMVRASDRDNGYVIALLLNGEVRLYSRENGTNRELMRKQFGFSVKPNYIYAIETTVSGDCIRVCIDGKYDVTFTDSTHQRGTVGFCQTAESWSVIHSLTVSSTSGETLYCDNMNGDESDYEYSYAEEFIADGAKRDRLPWVGDLYWANENVYYSFGNFQPLINTVEMFRRHQCPDGFVWGTCYPENRVRPTLHDYGMYQSDIFSAWYIITIAYHFLFTEDREMLEKWYSSVTADLEYLIGHIDGNGLFYQRYETSKGLWDHCLNDYGYYSYNNLILVKALKDGAFLAGEMGLEDEKKRYSELADALLERTAKATFDTEKGVFCHSITDRGLCYLATSFAFAFGLIPKEFADKTVKSMCEKHDSEFQAGKTVILFIKGCFKYGYSDIAFKILTGSTGKLDYLGKCTLNWIDAVRDEKGPACTAECMPYSNERIANGSCWNDSSHPDTSVAFLISAYVLGIRPTCAGFKQFRFAPNPCTLDAAEGTVPTPYGTIEASFTINSDGVMNAVLSYPEGISPIVELPERYKDSAIIKTQIKQRQKG